MRISKFKLKNYVSFYDEDAEDVELCPGINFVVGKNNSGKTALLDVLSHQSVGEPHRSTETIDRHLTGLSRNETRYEIDYQFEPQELLRILFAEKDSFYFPLAKRDSSTRHLLPIGIPSGFLEGKRDNMKYWYVSNKPEHVKLEKFRYKFPISGDLKLNCHKADASGSRAGDTLVVRYHVSNRATHIVKAQDTCWAKTSTQIPRYVYRFLAERRIGAIADVEEGAHLNSDASNLSCVLSVLSASRLEKYLQVVQSVIPEIQEILFKPGSGSVELQLSYYPSDKGRDDLAVSLDNCGTGVGQILAMLYVVLFYGESQPRVILIDEPNSFLHPGAVRKLLEIFQEHDHHQYVIATHSPTAIMSVKKKRILIVKQENKVSTVQSVNVESNGDLEEALKEIGSKRSDIFGMDAIVWVEGKTDEHCFRLIMDRNGGLPDGVNIKGLVNTGDLENKKHANLAVQIYQHLSGGVGLLPSVLGFAFDGDKDGAHQRLDEEYSNLIHYLPRHNYENYLIEFPGIIVDVMNMHKGDNPGAYTLDQVEKWICQNKSKPKFFADGADIEEDTWLQHINGAKFISHMFCDVSGGDRGYRKVQDGEEITKRILDEKPEHFQEIVDLITSILGKELKNSTT